MQREEPGSDMCKSGSDEFIDETIHRVGEIDKMTRRSDRKDRKFDPEALISAVEDVLKTNHKSFYGPDKAARSVFAKELLVLTGRRAGATIKTLSELVGLDPSTVSRRYDKARLAISENEKLQALSDKTLRKYQKHQS